jgi:hypothetical protein
MDPHDPHAPHAYGPDPESQRLLAERKAVSITSLSPWIVTNRIQMDKESIDYVIASNVHHGREDMERAGVDPLPSKEEMIAVTNHPVREVKERD